MSADSLVVPVLAGAGETLARHGLLTVRPGVAITKASLLTEASVRQADGTFRPAPDRYDYWRFEFEA